MLHLLLLLQVQLHLLLLQWRQRLQLWQLRLQGLLRLSRETRAGQQAASCCCCSSCLQTIVRTEQGSTEAVSSRGGLCSRLYPRTLYLCTCLLDAACHATS